MAAEPDLTPEQNQALRDALHHYMEGDRQTGPYSQKEIASKLAVSQQNVSAFLSGKTGVGRKIAERIAGMLGRQIGDFLVDFAPFDAGAVLPGAMPMAPALPPSPKLMAPVKMIPGKNTGEAGRAMKTALGLAFAPTERGHDVDDIATVLSQLNGQGVGGVAPALLQAMATVLLDAATIMRKGGAPVTPATFALAVALVSAANGRSPDELCDEASTDALDQGKTPEVLANPPDGSTKNQSLGRPPRVEHDFGDATDADDIPF
ncbi:MAG: hypothetical protein JWM10_4104 [Myxococcaceae bacterium]|nr:hypothetical protein [Myxococcaceae bacterium]